MAKRNCGGTLHVLGRSKVSFLCIWLWKENLQPIFSNCKKSQGGQLKIQKKWDLATAKTHLARVCLHPFLFKSKSGTSNNNLNADRRMILQQLVSLCSSLTCKLPRWAYYKHENWRSLLITTDRRRFHDDFNWWKLAIKLQISKVLQNLSIFTIWKQHYHYFHSRSDRTVILWERKCGL